MLMNGATPVTVDTMTWLRNSGRNKNTPFARGRSVTLAPTDSACSNGVRCPTGGGISSTKSSSSGSRGDDTFEPGQYLTLDPGDAEREVLARLERERLRAAQPNLEML